MGKYPMTDKVRERINKLTDWESRLEVLRLRNQGWTLQQIAEHAGISKQAVSKKLRKMEGMSVAEAEQLAQSLE